MPNALDLQQRYPKVAASQGQPQAPGQPQTLPPPLGGITLPQGQGTPFNPHSGQPAGFGPANTTAPGATPQSTSLGATFGNTQFNALSQADPSFLYGFSQQTPQTPTPTSQPLTDATTAAASPPPPTYTAPTPTAPGAQPVMQPGPPPNFGYQYPQIMRNLGYGVP